jgi:hypothetical protein
VKRRWTCIAAVSQKSVIFDVMSVSVDCTACNWKQQYDYDRWRRRMQSWLVLNYGQLLLIFIWIVESFMYALKYVMLHVGWKTLLVYMSFNYWLNSVAELQVSGLISDMCLRLSTYRAHLTTSRDTYCNLQNLKISGAFVNSTFLIVFVSGVSPRTVK